MFLFLSFSSWRPTLLLENYQPWLDLKVFSKVDASISEVSKQVFLQSMYEYNVSKAILNVAIADARFWSWFWRTLFTLGTGNYCFYVFFLFYNFYFTFGLGREAFDNALYVIYLCLRDITDDEACVDELRMMFRFFGAVIVRRAQKVSVPYYCK